MDNEMALLIAEIRALEVPRFAVADPERGITKIGKDAVTSEDFEDWKKLWSLKGEMCVVFNIKRYQDDEEH